MKDVPRYLGRAGAVLTRTRLAQYRRYAEIVAEQELALDAGDLEGFEKLLAVAAEVRHQVDRGEGQDPLDEADAEAAAEAASILALAAERGARIHERLEALRAGSAGEIRKLSQRRPQARRYVAAPASAPASGPHLDVKY